MKKERLGLEKEPDNFGLRTLTRASHPLHLELHTSISRTQELSNFTEIFLFNHCLLIH